MISVRVLCFLIAAQSFLLNACSPEKPAEATSQETYDTLAPPPMPKSVGRNPIELGTLRVLSLHSINSFFVNNGQPMGLEYELISRYALHKNLRVEVTSVHDYHELYDSLAIGNFDVVMGALIATEEWGKVLLQTLPIYQSDLVLVALDSVTATDTIRIIRNSPIAFWRDEIDSANAPPNFQLLGDTLSKEHALALVGLGQIPNILVDRNEFEVMNAFFPKLQVVRTIKANQAISFAFHPDLAQLREEFNDWFTSWSKHKSEYAWTLSKYHTFFHANRSKLQYEKPEIIVGRISSYDPLVKNYAQKIELDWLLISALMYQESRFRPDVESPVGARGLMQLMPSVATTYKVDFNRLKDPRKNVELGTRYFRYLYDHYSKDTLLTEENRIKFALASYNAGMGHIIDARALAQKHKLNPNVWDDHVATMLTKKHLREFNRDPVVKYGHFRGWETYGYVQNIMTYYRHYQTHIDEYFPTGTK